MLFYSSCMCIADANDQSIGSRLRCLCSTALLCWINMGKDHTTYFGYVSILILRTFLSFVHYPHPRPRSCVILQFSSAVAAASASASAQASCRGPKAASQQHQQVFSRTRCKNYLSWWCYEYTVCTWCEHEFKLSLSDLKSTESLHGWCICK